MLSLKATWQQQWVKLGLTRSLVIAVFKNALPSTAALWIIQSSKLGQQFDTVGFLPIIVTILMVPAQPRIPYLRLLIFTLFLNCIVLCAVLLAGYCSIQARLHTTPVGGRLDAYNSSASAISAIWLIFAVWALQTYRTYSPHRARSIVVCTIFAEVSIVTCSRLPDMASIIPFNVQLFEMFLLGYAFSAFTSLFIFPQSSRDVTAADIAKMLGLSQKATSSEKPFGELVPTKTSAIPESAAAVHIKALSQTFAKFELDISDAKKDVGFSTFPLGDYKEIVHHFRPLIISIRGLYAVESIRTALHFGSGPTQLDNDNTLEDPTSTESEELWDIMFEKLQPPISQLRQLTKDAMTHCQISLRLMPSSKLRNSTAHSTTSDDDPESEKTSRELPGGAGFVPSFKKQIDEKRNAMKLVLALCKDEDGQLRSAEHINNGKPLEKPHSPAASQRRLLFTLYIEHLYDDILDALLAFVVFCDRKFNQSKPTLQLPGKRRLFKLINRLSDHHHVEGDLEDIASEIPNLTPQRSHKPESPLHKPHGFSLHRLNTWMEKSRDIIGSPQSFFAFRVACAVMSVAIVGFLGQTQQWFFNQRGIWAAIFIPFSMAPSSGEAKSMLLYRVLGSLFSIPLSLVNWYIVDGIPAGVIVIYFVMVCVQQYFLVKFPQWGSFWRPCIITYTIIVGYSLQSRYSHIPQAPATTTNSYPIYLIGPYRCLCTLVGVAVAYVWTVFPKPTTANSVMGRRLGQALFGLAEYHSCMHWAVSSWAEGHQGDLKDKSSIAHRLMKARHRLFVKETAILAVIRDQHRYASFDISLRGSSAEHRYVTIADEVDRIMSYLNVVIFVSAHFQSYLHHESKAARRTGPWESGLGDLLIACKSTSGQLASLIHILASSITNNQPLPPFLDAPEPFAVARKMREMRPDLMNVQHADEEGFKAFAVIEISVAMITKSLDRVLVLVRDMVGEVGVDAGGDKNK